MPHPGSGTRPRPPALPPYGGNRWNRRAGFDGYHRYSDLSRGSLDYPYYGDYWDQQFYANRDYAPASGPTILLLTGPQPPEPVSPPPPVPTPVMHEYRSAADFLWEDVRRHVPRFDD